MLHLNLIFLILQKIVINLLLKRFLPIILQRVLSVKNKIRIYIIILVSSFLSTRKFTLQLKKELSPLDPRIEVYTSFVKKIKKKQVIWVILIIFLLLVNF